MPLIRLNINFISLSVVSCVQTVLRVKPAVPQGPSSSAVSWDVTRVLCLQAHMHSTHWGCNMAACMMRSSAVRTAGPGHWLRPRPGTAALVSRRAEGGPPPSSSMALKASGGGDKLRTIQDLPKVGLWEIIYRMGFQGYYNRLHELQVGCH